MKYLPLGAIFFMLILIGISILLSFGIENTIDLDAKVNDTLIESKNITFNGVTIMQIRTLYDGKHNVTLRDLINGIMPLKPFW